MCSIWQVGFCTCTLLWTPNLIGRSKCWNPPRHSQTVPWLNFLLKASEFINMWHWRASPHVQLSPSMRSGVTEKYQLPSWMRQKRSQRISKRKHPFVRFFIPLCGGAWFFGVGGKISGASFHRKIRCVINLSRQAELAGCISWCQEVAEDCSICLMWSEFCVWHQEQERAYITQISHVTEMLPWMLMMLVCLLILGEVIRSTGPHVQFPIPCFMRQVHSSGKISAAQMWKNSTTNNSKHSYHTADSPAHCAD